ncbi:hypothetical protein [Stutzerimonas nitrititolerans]|uniref:hypothetical protein n=1 Tax=Stutzerimonas nitrititolerans TaxID=2482751 RepID=UPI0028A120CF|nr:hypothetical protein [Stutzerimonas nitrititolerans]
MSLLKAFRPHCENTICSVRKNDRLGRSGYRPQRWPVTWAGMEFAVITAMNPVGLSRLPSRSAVKIQSAEALKE